MLAALWFLLCLCFLQSLGVVSVVLWFSLGHAVSHLGTAPTAWHSLQCELWITCSLSAAVVSLVWMAMPILFFHITSCAGSMSSLQQSLDGLLQAGLSVFHVLHLQAHLWSPLAIKTAMHEAAGSLTAPIPYHIYHQQKGLKPLSCIPA